MNTAPTTNTATTTPDAINAIISSDKPLFDESVGVAVDVGEFDGDAEVEGCVLGDGEAVAVGVPDGEGLGEVVGLVAG